jgi:hypothetical protein
VRLVILLAVAASLTACVWAQTSAYQTADGNTSVFLNNAKASIVFNVSDVKFDAGYLHEGAGTALKDGFNPKSLEYGFDVFGKPASSLENQVFQKGNAPPSFGVLASLGYHSPFADLSTQTPKTHLRDDWALVALSYTRSTFTTVASSTAEPVKQFFDGFRILPAYNALLNLSSETGTGVILGGAAGVQRTNNVDDLKPVTIDTPVLQSAAGQAPFSVVNQTSGYLGAYEKYYAAPIYTDAVVILNRASWVDFDFFTRFNAAHVDRYEEGGLGVFIARPEEPTKVLGGLSVGWKNGAPTYAVVCGFAF